MLCERILGKVTEQDTTVDWVEVPALQTTRRALKLVSQKGHSVRILLPRGVRLRHLDLISVNPRIAVRVRPIEVLVFYPSGVEQALRLAAEIGNLHLPMEFSGDCLLTPDDGPVRRIADELDIRYVVDKRIFHPDLRTSRMMDWVLRINK
ncbi:MAG: hypothetical protein KatS3mg104_0893 [Phycisphaerae bacterium]|jgi:urease accessory protein UreE|nr:MAG: hypothetical protein KatS3mg104_0893 [Phycisphaerae bacterium]